jgi:hypothetical protein
MNKKDIARLQDEITWDGSYLTVGIDHWAQWQGMSPLQASEGTGHTPAQLRNAIKRRPDLRLPLGKRKGEPWKLPEKHHD